MSTLYLFKHVPPEALGALVAVGTEQHFEAGDVVYAQGAPADAALILVSGKLEARLEEAGAERVLGDIRPGELVGETALLARSGRRGATVVAVEPSVGLELTPEQILEVNDNPAIAAIEVHMLTTMARRLRGVSLDIQRLVQQTQDVPVEATNTPPASLGSRLRAFFRGLRA